MAECKSCKAIYYFLEDSKGKIIPVDESSLTTNEYSALIGKMKVLFDPKRHRNHLHTCKNNIVVNKRKEQKEKTITNKIGKDRYGRLTNNRQQSKFDFKS